MISCIAELKIDNIELLIRYVPIRLERKRRDEAYRIYITDSLKAISESISKLAGGSTIAVRYEDIINRNTIKEKSSEEIISELVRKGGIKIK